MDQTVAPNFCCRWAGLHPCLTTSLACPFPLCRREEESPRYHKQEENSVQLSMMRDFRFLGGATSAEALR